jgi:hypothetical protein
MPPRVQRRAAEGKTVLELLEKAVLKATRNMYRMTDENTIALGSLLGAAGAEALVFSNPSSPSVTLPLLPPALELKKVPAEGEAAAAAAVAAAEEEDRLTGSARNPQDSHSPEAWRITVSTRTSSFSDGSTRWT